MKGSIKRMTAVLLTVLTAFTAASTVSFSAAATEATTAPATVETTVEPQTEATAPTEDAFGAPVSATEPQSQTDATEPATEPAPVVEVGKVTGLKKTTTNVNNINMVWNKTTGATGYVVYRCSVDYDNGVYKKVADVKTNTYNDTGLVQGSPYNYKIAAYKTIAGKNYQGEFTLYKTATQPAKVTNLLRSRSSETLEISWTRNVKASGYKIFRASAETNNEYVLYKTLESGSITRFADTKVKMGSIYYYKVVAFRVLPNGNWYHSPGTALALQAGLCAPNFSFSSKLYTVSLSWLKNAYATRYDIYYSTNKDAQKYTFAGSTTGTSYTTNTRFANGSQYYFRVYPIYKKNGVTVTGTAHSKLVTVTNKIYGVSAPTTYVEVSISQQRMWLVKNLTVIVDTPVVTGTLGVSDTPKGYFDIYQRATDTVLYGDDYASPVDYWMAFSGGCGLHDASWRSTFGGDIYTYDGSHGCVNTPYNAVRTIYNNTTYGTPVIVY